MSQPAPGNDRRDDLQADRALFGLSDAEARELASLGHHGDELAPDASELAAAAFDLSLHTTAEEPLPERLRQRILAASRPEAGSPLSKLESQAPVAQTGLARHKAPRNSRRRELLAWLATAAAVIVAFVLGVRRGDEGQPTAAELRIRLLAQRSEQPGTVVQLAWTRGADDAGAAADGDVLWSTRDQAGVMRFRGLAANNPTRQQYQLWIFDAERDERYPVDGGVFDIPAGGDEVLVPIRARLPIAKPTLFAITVERPGGVVVSDRSRLPLLASVP